MATSSFSKKYETDIDVVTAAKQRIINAFDNKLPIYMSISGGKDSICLNHLVYELVKTGKADKSLLTVVFIDEEGIYPCVERVVKELRNGWLLAGVKFDWYAMQYKHFNCLNQLTQDESFICFDETKKDVWIRQPPSYAIRDHKKLRKGKDNYQNFLEKLQRNAIGMIGVRASESCQRRMYIAKAGFTKKISIWPIYDWKDTDVWKYIYDNNLDFPDAYIYLYQVGTSLNKMRLSQFFSVDTIGSLVMMCQFYPDLFDRICKREPNAYMAMLYYDTELFRRKKTKKNENEDFEYYKKYVLDYLNDSSKWPESNKRTLKRMKSYLYRNSLYFLDKHWKTAYQICVAGDPKCRTLRSLNLKVIINRKKIGAING